MKKRWKKVIMHVDMDAFFAAVEERDLPELKKKPLIIGADPKDGRGRGVVSTANYVARKFGIHSAMPVSEAYKRCPHGVFLPPDGHKYSEASRQIMKIFDTFSPVVQPVSVDEAFLDMSGTEGLFGPPQKCGQLIKDRIWKETGLTASVGVSQVKTISKIASDFDKPDGLTIVEPGTEKDFLRELEIERIWGIGKKAAGILHRKGIYFVGDLQELPRERLISLFGEHGNHLFKMANAIDDRNVIPASKAASRKSISAEHTYLNDTADTKEIDKSLLKIADRLAREMRSENIFGKTVTVKIRLTGFDTYTRSKTLGSEIRDPATIYRIAQEIFNKFDPKGKKIRLIGISLSQIVHEGEGQLRLIEEQQISDEKIEKTVDSLQDRFGKESLTRAVLLKSNKKKDR